MTLVASSPTTTLTPKPNNDDSVSLSDTQSQSSTDDVIAVQTYNPVESLVQSLGYPESDTLPPHFGQVSIENSSDVHFGDKNIYQGPVTIRQIVYANGTSLAGSSDIKNKPGCKDNLGYDASDSDCVKDGFGVDFSGDKTNCDINGAARVRPDEGDANDLTILRKGFIWLQNVSKQRPVEIGIFIAAFMLLLVILTTVLFLKHSPASKVAAIYDSNEQDEIRPLEYDPDITATSQIKNKLRIVSRIEWVAQPPINTTTPLVTPVPYVIIHHTATENCSSIGQCVFHVRYIQTFHIDSKGFYDIGYNYLVGGDGAAYEGRGWTVEGAHAFGYNSRSIGIAFIGTFITAKPPEIQILACKKLIQKGVELGYIRKDYKLLAARQLSGTESPGAVLYEEMKTWPHWAKEP